MTFVLNMMSLYVCRCITVKWRESLGLGPVWGLGSKIRKPFRISFHFSSTKFLTRTLALGHFGAPLLLQLYNHQLHAAICAREWLLVESYGANDGQLMPSRRHVSVRRSSAEIFALGATRWKMMWSRMGIMATKPQTIGLQTAHYSARIPESTA